MALNDASKSEIQELQEKLASVKELIIWNRKIFSTFGLDPMNVNYFVYSIAMLYVTLQTIMTGLSLPENLEYVDQTIDCSNELIGLALVIYKLYAYKTKAPLLAKLLGDVDANLSIDRFKSQREVAIFFKYMSYAKTYFKVSIVTAYVAATFYFLRIFALDGGHMPTQTNSHNVTTYLPPYRVKFYVPLVDLTTYSVALIYFLPMITVAANGYMLDGNLFVILVAHACSHLAVLSHCWLELLGDHPKQFRRYAAEAIRKNYYIMKFVRDINLVFSTMMLQQRAGAAFALCLFMYGGLVDWRRGEKVAILITVVYVSGAICAVFVYSFVGQCLIDESLYLNEALCISSWYNLKSQDLKYYLILLAHMQKPLYIDCGGFFVFSFDSFVTMLKSAMAYLSRTQAQKELDVSARMFRWNRILMKTLGLWPRTRSDVWFCINFGYFCYYMLLEYLDLFLFIDNLEHVIMNLTEIRFFAKRSHGL